MTEVMHPKLKVRRDRIRSDGRCICGPLAGYIGAHRVHGPVVRTNKCQICLDIHGGRPLPIYVTMVPYLLLLVIRSHISARRRSPRQASRARARKAR